MKWLYRTFCIFIIVFTLTACSNSGYKVLASLETGSIQIEYKGVIYTQTGSFNGNPPGEKVFHINYNEVCSTVAYDAYLDNTTMYLIGQQPFWADVNAVNFVLTAEGSTDNS